MQNGTSKAPTSMMYFWIPSFSFLFIRFSFHPLPGFIHTHTHTHTYCDIPYRQAVRHTCCWAAATIHVQKDPLSFALNCTYRVFNSPIRKPANTISTTYVHVRSKCPLMQLCCWVRVHVYMHAPVKYVWIPTHGGHICTTSVYVRTNVKKNAEGGYRSMDHSIAG